MPAQSGRGHIPVLLNETLALLNLGSGDTVLDLTLGGGGHAEAMLERTAPKGILIGVEADPVTLDIAKARLQKYSQRTHLLHDNFVHAAQRIHEQFPDIQLRGVLLDLGLSSLAIEALASRFSFLSSAPLDFRFDPTSAQATAADILNTASEQELKKIFKEYGEESAAGRIARAIVTERQKNPFTHIPQLVACIDKVKPKRGRSRIHPATQVFQALRIKVNDELDVLARVLPEVVHLLQPGGRIAVLSYHSLEDRIVKRFFRRESTDCICPAQQPVCTCNHHASLQVLTKKPVVPGQDEIAHNSRSRSAKLRVAEKIQ
ncbi:MAG: 16S rRNA (cytosine(1402)-N(4))-methyltransferase RsmH [Candidatus Nomurabacteria bacterium]|nr:MAG: 16S rRNA (cytosine(1402)-N(4))-methyltransferase RsmH [Candidatus Nomurabacteria bacterium]